ncbi:MAG: cytochrome c [Pseudomonadota bacterium]
MAQTLWWASESFWRKTAIWVTGGSFIILIFLTFDTMKYITAGGKQVPGYAIINKRVDYQFNEAQNRYLPVIGPDEPLFGKMLSEQEAEALVTKGKLTTQAKNCMECHTLLGNGAYYAPDLTKAWLDPAWGSKEVREESMVAFLMDPSDKLHNSIGRRMPKLGITEEEARATVAFLKWMSAINTLGFPHNFKAIDQSDPAPASAPAASAPATPEVAPAADAAPAQQ